MTAGYAYSGVATQSEPDVFFWAAKRNAPHPLPMATPLPGGPSQLARRRNNTTYCMREFGNKSRTLGTPVCARVETGRERLAISPPELALKHNAITDAACAAWRNLPAEPETTSIGMRDWPHVEKPIPRTRILCAHCFITLGLRPSQKITRVPGAGFGCEPPD